MLKDYVEKVQDQRRSHPITQDDFDRWRHNIITRQLFEDLELLKLSVSENIHAEDSTTAGLQSANLNGVQYAVKFVDDWLPECLETNDE